MVYKAYNPHLKTRLPRNRDPSVDRTAILTDPTSGPPFPWLSLPSHVYHSIRPFFECSLCFCVLLSKAPDFFLYFPLSSKVWTQSTSIFLFLIMPLCKLQTNSDMARRELEETPSPSGLHLSRGYQGNLSMMDTLRIKQGLETQLWLSTSPGF